VVHAIVSSFGEQIVDVHPSITEAAMPTCLGKSGVVTGASGGLGRATVLALAADGANVLALSRNADTLAETARLADGLEGTVLAMPADVCDETAVLRAIENVEEQFQAMDFVVNNAGMQIEKGLLDTTNDDWDAIDRTKVRAPFCSANTRRRPC
jgi:NAD(P)-dependent dehydrogenase (short-subunit alcohol dehydrogenase family)